MRIMRIMRIDLDDDELPQSVAVRATWDVMDRLCRDHMAIRDGRWKRRAVGLWWSNEFPMTWVTRVARHYAALPPDDGTGSAIYRCLSKLCCRFWENGIEGAPIDEY